jgi:hypothetical protein
VHAIERFEEGTLHRLSQTADDMRHAQQTQPEIAAEAQNETSEVRPSM